MDQGDNELMHHIQAGDKNAFEELVKKYRKRAEMFCYSIIKDDTTIQDIVQDCFVDLYLMRMNYQFNYEFSTFFFTIVKNKSIDYLRKNKKQQEVSLENVKEPINFESPEKLFLDLEKRKQIFQIISSLKSDYREVLYLYAVESLSYKEIAAKLNKSLPQIKIILYRARKKAFQIKEEWEHE